MKRGIGSSVVVGVVSFLMLSMQPAVRAQDRIFFSHRNSTDPTLESMNYDGSDVQDLFDATTMLIFFLWKQTVLLRGSRQDPALALGARMCRFWNTAPGVFLGAPGFGKSACRSLDGVRSATVRFFHRTNCSKVRAVGWFSVCL